MVIGMPAVDMKACMARPTTCAAEQPDEFDDPSGCSVMRHKRSVNRTDQ